MRSSRYTDTPDKAINWKVLLQLWPYLLEFRRRIFGALLFMVAAKLASVALPFVLKHIVDGLSAEQEPQWWLAPIALVVAYGVVRFANVFFGEVRDTLFGRVTERAMRRLGLTVFQHLHALDLDFHLDRQTGGIARDIERGTSGISFLMRFLVFNIVPTILEIGMVIGIFLFNYGWTFALTTVLAIIAYVAYSVIATEWRTKFVREANRADSASNTRAIDSLINYETVKYFNNESFEAQRYDVELANWEFARRKNRLSLFALNGGQALIITVAMTMMMYLAVGQVNAELMTVGDFVLINAFMMQLFMPLNFLGFVYREIKVSFANIERLFELLGKTPKIQDADEARPIALTVGEVTFDQVVFYYSEARPIIQAISFTIHAGEKVAVVGSSGAGKSTLVKLLFRFYDPNSGAILIDGQNIAEVTQASVRQHIGIVPQDTVLFNDTILENIRYGRPSASDEDVQQAIKHAHLAEFIATLPDGLQTKVGERGLKLSGGEKQRVAIARAILKDPAILIFDEATSSLDSESEQAVLSALRDISTNKTSLVIAHRLSTIIDADRILVLHEGRIVEQGKHSELLATNGMYKRLWDMQLKEH